MTGDTASYIESLRPHLSDIVATQSQGDQDEAMQAGDDLDAARQTQIMKAICVLQGLVRAHVEFDVLSDGTPARIPEGKWNDTGELMWMGLLDSNREPIGQERADGDAWRFVRHADVRLYGEDGTPHENGVTVAAIQLDPPNVFGPDGVPLQTQQIAGLITDLWQYEQSLPSNE